MAHISPGEDPHHSTLKVSQEIANCIQMVSKELVATEERERHRLAMELHDYLAQLLVVTKMQLVESHQGGNSDTGNECVKKAEGLLDQALAYVRSLIVDLYPKSLYEKGLPYALESLIGRLEQVGLKVTLQHDPFPDTIPQEQSLFLFPSIRELLFNVIKHAGVREAQIFLRPGPRQHIKITVEDKGKGFDPRAALEEDGQETFGLSEICRRAEALGVRVNLKSAPGHGTCITFSIPKTGKRKSLPAKRTQETQIMMKKTSTSFPTIYKT
jgi:signal transduction histidine kinase